jgi:hypothetical protein
MNRFVDENDPNYLDLLYLQHESEDQFDVADIDNGIMKGYTVNNIIDKVPDSFIKILVYYNTFKSPEHLGYKEYETDINMRIRVIDQTDFKLRKLYSFLKTYCKNSEKYTETQTYTNQRNTPFCHLIMWLFYIFTIKNYKFYQENKYRFMYERSDYEDKFGYDYIRLGEFQKLTINNSPFAQRLRQHKHTLFSGF